MLAGSIRRGGSRLRITAQLVDAASDSLLWSERYDREMADVFAVQDEIARKIAEALRVTLSPQEQEAIAAKPTANLQAYDLYLRGRSYARRHTRQDLEFALQMFENAVSLDHEFALAHAAISNVCAQYHYNYERQKSWLDRSRDASRKAIALQPAPARGRRSPRPGSCTRRPSTRRPRTWRQEAVERKRDTEGAYYLMLRALFAAGRYQDVAAVADAALEASGTDYNVYVPIMNALRRLGKKDALDNMRQREIAGARESPGRRCPRTRARAASSPATMLHRPRRRRRARGQPLDHAAAQRGDGALQRGLRLLPARAKPEALAALRKAWEAGFEGPELGAPRPRPRRCCTATRSSSGSTRRGHGGRSAAPEEGERR